MQFARKERCSIVVTEPEADVPPDRSRLGDRARWRIRVHFHLDRQLLGGMRSEARLSHHSEGSASSLSLSSRAAMPAGCQRSLSCRAALREPRSPSGTTFR